MPNSLREIRDGSVELNLLKSGLTDAEIVRREQLVNAWLCCNFGCCSVSFSDFHGIRH